MNSSNEYSGSALNAFVLGLRDSDVIVKRLLTEGGVDRIDPEGWYDYDWAMKFFYQIERELGRAALIEVGRKMIETATYPPEINSVQALLPGLGYWFSLNARGPEVGTITCDFEDDNSATLEWSARGPCSLCIGILEGACARYQVKPLIEHGADGCKDTGASACVYHVSW